MMSTACGDSRADGIWQIRRQIMIQRASQQVVEAPIGWAFGKVSDQTKRVWARIAAWADACATYYAAAAMYEQLSALSDAELTRRGLSRASLARDVRAACDGGAGP